LNLRADIKREIFKQHFQALRLDLIGCCFDHRATSSLDLREPGERTFSLHLIGRFLDLLYKNRIETK